MTDILRVCLSRSLVYLPAEHLCSASSPTRYSVENKPVGLPLARQEPLAACDSACISAFIAENLAGSRRARRQRNLDQVEIPEDDVTITDQILGKGGFGTVYLADYLGRNVACKVSIECMWNTTGPV